MNVIHALDEALPRVSKDLIEAMRKANQDQKLFPKWRETQNVQFISVTSLYVQDVNERYRAQRLDSIAQSVRGLLEINIWTRYCSMSESNARIFHEDAARDMRELMELGQKLETEIKGKPSEGMRETQDAFQAFATAYGVKDYDGRFMKVADAAEVIGRKAVYALMYKMCSKLAHPTALMLTLEKQHQEFLDAMYVGGILNAADSLGEIDEWLKKQIAAPKESNTSRS